VYKQGKTAYNIPKQWDPFPDPTYSGAWLWSLITDLGFRAC